MVDRRGTTVIAVAGALLMVSGCTSQSPTPPTTTTTSSAASPSTVPSLREVTATEATGAYLQALSVLSQMNAAPELALKDYPTEWKVTEHLTDPFLSAALKGLADLKRDGMAVRNNLTGVQPIVLHVEEYATPRLVTLTFCPKKAAEFYFVKTGHVAVGTLPSGAAKPPYQVTSTMIERDGHWLLQQHQGDSSKTCTPL